MMKKVALTIILFVTLVTITISFPTYIFAGEKELTPNELNLLKETKLIRVVFKAFSWIDRSKSWYIQSEIQNKLKEVGFTIIEDETKNYDATIFVDYEDKKGAEYGSLYRKGGIFGTYIECFIKLDHKKVGVVFEKKISASTSPSVSIYGFGSNEALQSNAIENFRKTQDFQTLTKEIYERTKLAHLAIIMRTSDASLLVNALKDGSPAIRIAAAKKLGELKDPRAVEPLIEALENADLDSRCKAAQVLGELKLKDCRVVNALIARLQHDVAIVRKTAGEALQMIMGQYFGEAPLKWQEWWEKNKPK